MSRSSHLLELAKAKGAMIATAESCTAGMISAAITDEPGSSAIFDRGFVTYTNAAKQEMLGISPDTLSAFGAVSEEIANEMARGALERSAAKIVVSVTGIAGPGGSEFKPEGRVCFGIAIGSKVETSTVEFGPIGRANVRVATVKHAIELLITALHAN